MAFVLKVSILIKNVNVAIIGEPPNKGATESGGAIFKGVRRGFVVIEGTERGTGHVPVGHAEEVGSEDPPLVDSLDVGRGWELG